MATYLFKTIAEAMAIAMTQSTTIGITAAGVSCVVFKSFLDFSSNLARYADVVALTVAERISVKAVIVSLVFEDDHLVLLMIFAALL